MADLSIRKDFIDGTYEIFTTLFNEGISDGIELYLMSDKTRVSVYGESKYKKYKKPILLVSHVRIDSVQGKQDVEKIKHQASFVVPLKSFQDNGIGVTREDLNTISKGVIKFQGVYYNIDEILPRVYIEDVFLYYHFVCVEDTSITSLSIEEDGF